MANATEAARKLAAPTSDYHDAEGNVLTLRGSLTQARVASTPTCSPAASSARTPGSAPTELLFERLAVSWTISGLEITRQKELLGRYRMASPEERQFVRDSLREHVAEHFPELQAP